MPNPMSARDLLDVHVVSHTHWDREWYRTSGEFRQLLVPLIDELLDDPGTSSFLLDGQTILLEDYLSVRPERAAELRNAFRQGTLEAGPWYVLADELIPSGEALVRNLLAGRRVMRSVGATPPPVLYSPDAFGHAAALPTLAVGFGASLAVVWRGYGGSRWPPGDVVRWRAAEGAVVLILHLPPDGYEFGASLPTDAEGAASRWKRVLSVLGGRSSTGIVLLPNGADHHARQAELRLAIQALATAAQPHPVRCSRLVELSSALATKVAANRLPEISGELRDSYGYTWTLSGTLGTRAAQKRRNAIAERLLVHDVEPWLAMAALRGAASSASLLDVAWRELLACHPHDSLCGCSVDAVAHAVDARLTSVIAQATALSERTTRVLAGHDADAAMAQRDRWRQVVLLRNRVPRPRSGVAEIEIDVVLSDAPVGPGSGSNVQSEAADPVVVPSAPRPQAALDVQLAGVSPPQWLTSTRSFSREEAPRHYPRNALVQRRRALVWVEQAPPYGLVTLGEGAPQRLKLKPALRARALRRGISNGLLDVEVIDGGVRVRAGDRVVENAVTLESRGEKGDLYTPSGIRGTEGGATLARWRTSARGPLRAELTTWWNVPIAARRLVSATGTPVEHGSTMERVEVTLQLDAGTSFVRAHVSGAWKAPDARLRCAIRTGVTRGETWADAAFGDVRRVPAQPSAKDQEMERYVATAPLQRFVSRYSSESGATVFSDGMAEYEAVDDGAIAVTLVRAVGELSRSDLPERPGHAGWPTETPDAQSLGPFEATFALALHGPRSSSTVAAVHELAEDFLLPLTGTSWRSAIEPASVVRGFELSGPRLVASAMKTSEDREWTVLRCVNVADEWSPGRWFHPEIRDGRLARLDESPLGALVVRDGIVDFIAPPRGVVTILVR